MSYRLTFVQVLVLGALATLAAASGCGRSDLTDYTYGDGGPNGDSGACNPTTCPTGCCTASGTCSDGKELNTCGFGGSACNDCQAEGFDFCDVQLQACATIQQTCNATTCAKGCCTINNGQTVCVSGVSSLACGVGGEACINCTTSGEECNPSSQTCVAAPCGPMNCMGCCAGATCVPMESDTQCGTGGLACTDCKLQNEFCNDATGMCVATPPLCNSTNCATGCCAGDTCVTSESNTQCGTGGAACTDCTTTSEVCNSGVCSPTCTSMSCPGCCLTGTCFAGFIDTRCGSGGASCVDCTATMTTCDISTTPRVCESTTTCPATYGGCGSSVTTPVLSITSGDCGSSDLADAKAACAAGFNSTSCQSFFSGEPLVNPSCAKCLAPFQYALTDGTGIFNCVSPYVSSTCNHDTGCVADCETQSCDMCSPSAEPTCITQVEMGQCSTYISGASCIGTALFGMAAFCSPTTYFGNYGDWLAGVGAHYCE